MNLKQSLMECVPDAYYSDGTKATCFMFKIFNMFDIDSQSFKGVNDQNIMKKEKESETKAIPGNLNRIFSVKSED